MYEIYIAKAAENFGLAATRAIYARAVEVLPDRQTAQMCLRFAALERKLGEIDRARVIYAHASQFCDPRVNPDFWSEWNSPAEEVGLRSLRDRTIASCQCPKQLGACGPRQWSASRGPSGHHPSHHEHILADSEDSVPLCPSAGESLVTASSPIQPPRQTSTLSGTPGRRSRLT